MVESERQAGVDAAELSVAIINALKRSDPEAYIETFTGDDRVIIDGTFDVVGVSEFILRLFEERTRSQDGGTQKRNRPLSP